MNFYHEPSNTTFCDLCYRVITDEQQCRCEAEPTPPAELEPVRESPFVDYHAAERFRERVSPAATWRECIESVRRIVLQGAQLPAAEVAELRGRPDCQYFALPAVFPLAVAVRRPSTNAVVTILIRGRSGRTWAAERLATAETA